MVPHAHGWLRRRAWSSRNWTEDTFFMRCCSRRVGCENALGVPDNRRKAFFYAVLLSTCPCSLRLASRAQIFIGACPIQCDFTRRLKYCRRRQRRETAVWTWGPTNAMQGCLWLCFGRPRKGCLNVVSLAFVWLLYPPDALWQEGRNACQEIKGTLFTIRSAVTGERGYHTTMDYDCNVAMH